MRAKIYFSFILFACSLLGYTQDKESDKISYYQFDLSTPLRVNQYAGEIDEYSGEKEPWFLVDGLSGRFGFGVHHNQWVAVGLNTGFDWKASERLVAVPLFASLKLSPKVSEDGRISLQVGYGKSFALGHQGRVGDFKKISLGFGDSDSFSLFVELCQYGFSLDGINKVGSLSLGISITTF